jgi:chromate reductase, NAD(P)H dehydrogenase (quinone)
MNPKVLVFAGSTRKGSLHRKLAVAAAADLRARGLDVTMADLRDYPMPLYDGDLETESGVPENARAFRNLLEQHDVFVIASPEYNGSFPALLKNVIDWTSRPVPGERPAGVFRGKKAALLSASPGPGGGNRGLRHLRELLQMIGVDVLLADVTVPRALSAFDEEGFLTRPEDVAAVDHMGQIILAACQRAPVAA